MPDFPVDAVDGEIDGYASRLSIDEPVLLNRFQRLYVPTEYCLSYCMHPESHCRPCNILRSGTLV